MKRTILTAVAVVTLAGCGEPAQVKQGVWQEVAVVNGGRAFRCMPAGAECPPTSMEPAVWSTESTTAVSCFAGRVCPAWMRASATATCNSENVWWPACEPATNYRECQTVKVLAEGKESRIVQAVCVEYPRADGTWDEKTPPVGTKGSTTPRSWSDGTKEKP